MFRITEKNGTLISPVTFSKLNMTENDLEEILRNNIELICDEEESMLVVGKQVRNEQRGISDITAVDHNGSIVLVEIKRDRQDIVSRKESFEFQAIRYAASYATIESVEEMVEKIYGPYIQKYTHEYQGTDLTPFELGYRKLIEFLEANDSEKSFNTKQRIILVASDFDEQTLSAVAWLNSNNVDISCYKLIPYEINEDVFINVEKILPINDVNEYYVNFSDPIKKTTTKKITRRTLPKIQDMLNWGVVREGDILLPKGRENQSEAILLNDGNVNVNGEVKSMHVWLKEIYEWSSVQSYAFAIHKESNKTLSQIREEYMIKHDLL